MLEMKRFKFVVVFLTVAFLLPLAILLLPDAPDADHEILDFPTEKSKIMASKQGHPDQFWQYHHDIRASADGEIDYPPAYRYKAFQKATAALKTESQRLNWVERGPGNVGGRSRPILIDPDDPDRHTWWVGSVGGGLWKTINRGLAWQHQTDDLPIMAVTSLAMADSDHNVIYMGTGEGFGNLDAIVGNGIFRSDDRGETWEHLSSTMTGNFRFVNRLVVSPTDPDVVVAATNIGIFRTEDGGMTWENVFYHESNSFAGAAQDLRAQPGNFDMQIAGINAVGVFFSVDAGKTWEKADVSWIDGFRRLELAYSSGESNVAYVSTSGGRSAQLYRSTDGGMTFVPTIGTAFDWHQGQGWYDNTLAVDPFDSKTVFLGGVELWRAQVSAEAVPVSGPSDFNTSEVDDWVSFVNFGGSAFGGRVSYLDPNAVDVSAEDYGTLEIRFGQGTQKAHRFWVMENAGTYEDGGEGIPFTQYRYGDYVEVPLQIWDTENDRQLMFSFRDQADDGEFNLIHFFNDAGSRDNQSREYMLIHKYDYDAENPTESIAKDGGLVNGLLYFMWPVLNDDATWEPDGMSSQTITIKYSVTEGFERSIDSWADASRAAHVDHHGLEPLVMDEAGERFWLLNTNDGGAAVSTDNGHTFQELDNAFAGFNTAQFYGVSKKPGSPVYLAGAQDNGTWRSFANPDNKRGWVHLIGGDGFETVWHAEDPDKLLGTVQFGMVFRSSDGGSSWQNTRPMDFVYGLFITSLASSDKSPDEVYTVNGQGVLVSRDFGLNWTLTSITEGWGGWHGAKVRVSIADPDVVWAGDGMAWSPDRKLHVSKDAGVTFQPAGMPLLERAPVAVISGLATHPTEEGTAYALFSRSDFAKVLETKDFGETWMDLSAFDSTGESANGFPDVAVHDLVVMPHAPNVLWVGTDIGLFRSNSYGKEWSYASNGLPAVCVWRMKIRDEEVVVGTHGRGVWTVPIDEIYVGTEEEEANEVPSGFSLAQNYPNPFNASTTIRFTVSTEAKVKLTVFDAAGRKMVTLADRVYSPGVHHITWNADTAASGVYFYRMESDGQLIDTQQMTLVK